MDLDDLPASVRDRISSDEDEDASGDEMQQRREEESSSQQPTEPPSPFLGKREVDESIHALDIEQTQLDAARPESPISDDDNSHQQSDEQASEDEEARDRVGIELHQTVTDASLTISAHSSAAVSSSSKTTPHHFLGPSPSLQRQVAEAQAAAVKLAKEQEQKQQQQSSKSVKWNEERKELVSAQNARPSTTTGVETVESMQVLGRVVSVLSINNELSCCDTSSDGSLFVQACGRVAHIWFTPSMRHALQLNSSANGGHVVHQSPLRLVKFTPFDPIMHAETGCGFHLLTVGDDMKMVLWNLTNGKLIRIFLGHKDLIFDAYFARTCDLLFTSSADGNLLCWDWKYSGNLLGSYAKETGGIHSISILEDFHKVLLSTPHDGCTHIWDINLQQRIASIEPDNEWKKKYQPTGATNGGWIDAQRFHTGRVLVVRASPDQTTLATGSADSTVKLWNILNLRRDHASVMAAKQAKPVKRSHLIPFTYNNEPATDSNDSESGIYNPSSNSSYPSSSYNPYVPSESATHYTSSNLDGEESPLSDEGYHASLLHTLRHEGEVHAVEWTPDSAFLISASRDCTVRVWMAEMGKLLYQVNLPTAILTMNFTYNPHLFEAPSVNSSEKNPDSPSSKTRNFYLGRLHVALKSRVLVMDLSVLESLVKVPKAGSEQSSNVASSTTKPSTAPTKPKKRKPSSRASHHQDTTPSEPVQLVASDALVSQYLPGADRIRALFAADRPLSSPSGSDPDALIAMASRLEFAPSFLHQLLSSPMGSGVSRETLADNMRYFGLTSTFLLRIISNTIHFKPNQILLGFAKPRPDCNPLFKLAFGGVPIDSAMIDMGFFPSKVQLSPGSGTGAAALSNRQAGLSKPDPSGVMSADSAKVYEPPSNPHATAEGVEGTPAAASETVRREGRHQPFHFIAGSAAYGDNAEGFFYALTDPSLVAPHVTPSSEVGQKSMDPDANFSEGLIHWEPATQLNLLAHLSSNAPIAPVHAEAALDENHVKYPLFGLGRKDAADEREKLELRRRGTLADPYGGSRALQQNNLTENARSIAHTLAKDRVSNRREMKMAKASVIGTNPIAAPTTGTVYKGITLPLSSILDPARHFAGAPHFDPTASVASLHGSGSVYALSSNASTAQLDSHVASLSEKEFASFVAGQVVPNGERIVGRALVEKSGSDKDKDSDKPGKIKDHFPRRNESMQFDDLPGTPNTRARLEDAMSLRRDAALDHSVAIPLRKSIGLKPVSNTLDAESGRKLLGIKQSGPGARIESRVTIDVSDTESLGDGYDLQSWSEAASGPPGPLTTGKSGEDPFSPFGKRTFHKPSRREARMSVKNKLATFDAESSAPVSLNILLETFSATEIEKQTKLSLDTLHLHAAVPSIITSADKIAEAGKAEVAAAIEKDRSPRVGVLQSTRGNLKSPAAAAAATAATPGSTISSSANGKKASVYTFAQPSPSPRGGKPTGVSSSTNLNSTTHGQGGGFESQKSPGQSQVNTATAQLLRDNDFRQEIRRTLLHQTNTLAALDAEVSLSSSLSGGGGLGNAAPVREYTYSQQQLIAPFGGTGSSGLTLTPHTSAHALVGSGMKETFAIGSNAVLSAHMTGGGVKGFSEEYTSRSNVVTPSLTSPFYQFSNMPQRIFSSATPRSSHGRSGSEKDLSKPSTATKEKEAQEQTVPMFPGMRELEARSPQSQARTLNNPSQSIETQLQKAFPPEKKQKWLNKFSNDVPGLDVIFDAAMPITNLPSSNPSTASLSVAPQTPSSFSSFPSPYTKKSDRLSNDGSNASTPSFLAASDSQVPFSPLDLSLSLEAVTEHPKEEGPAAKPKAAPKHGRRAVPAAASAKESKPKNIGLSVGVAPGSQTARPSRRNIVDKSSGAAAATGSMTARGSISKLNNINEVQSARLEHVARGRPVQSAAASRTNISTNSTIETPSFTPQVVSVTPSASILTRPFILRPSDQSSTVASAAAKAAENQAIDLGLDILPDIKALHGPTKVDLDAPKPIHSAAHRAVEIVPSATTEEGTE